MFPMIEGPILNSHGERLDYRFARATGGTPKSGWLVILAHGVTGNLDRPLIADTAVALNAAGFDTLRFSFAGNGASEGDFRAATISKESSDLSAVIDAAVRHYPKIAVVGHSMGAAVAVVTAAGNSRISALVSLAGMVDTLAFAKNEFGHVDPDHGLMWDEPECPLSIKFMVDLCDTIADVTPQAERVAVPWLLVHGTADDVVLPGDTESIAALRGDAVTANFIEGADHSFSDPGHKTEALRVVTEWLSSVAGE